MAEQWHVYIARCADGTYYCGIARDVAKRIVEHNCSEKLAARYTRGRRPVELVYCEEAASRSAAVKREGAIKRMSRQQKERLMNAPSQAATALQNKY